jgi:hypothetical protein
VSAEVRSATAAGCQTIHGKTEAATKP